MQSLRSGKEARLEALPRVARACQRRDTIRIWPLPVVDAKFEDWWERAGEKRLNG